MLSSIESEECMRPGILLSIATTALVAGVLSPAPGNLRAQTSGPVALGGMVSSQAEGTMEGVVVNARRDGANFTVSVVSDAQGNYSFPRTHLEPGTYMLTIRAVGYEMTAATPAAVTA